MSLPESVDPTTPGTRITIRGREFVIASRTWTVATEVLTLELVAADRLAAERGDRL